MKVLLFILLAVALCRDVLDAEVTMQFGSFINQFNKKYDNLEETIKRYHIFAENYRYIEKHNSKNGDYKLGVNQFADLTLPEFKAYLLKYRKPTIPCTIKHTKVEGKPEIDWRPKFVSRVKDQGSCGSCWAFSAVGALESLSAIKRQAEIIEYSEQEIVDCAKKGWGENDGCNGGDMCWAFEYVAENGISLSKEYPYEARDKPCRKKSNSFQIKGCVNVTADDSNELLEALTIGPVSIAVKANNRAFMYYRSGIITSGCGTDRDELDHGILLVGAAIDKSVGPYWIVKNSWGTYWGQHGYAYIKRDTAKGHGVCGIAMEDSYPVA